MVDTLRKEPQAPTVATGSEAKSSPARKVLHGIRELWRDKAGFFGIVVVIVFVLTALLAPLVAPHDPSSQSLDIRLMPPFWEHGGSFSHPLGTDQLGRDMLSRIIYRLAYLAVGGRRCRACLDDGGSVFGVISGYIGGRVDEIIMRIVDTQGAFPGLLLAMLILAAVGHR